MGYPTPSEYQEALQHPADAFADPELQAATPRTGPLGLPRPVTGAFAAVFPMTTGAGVTYAAKCFLSGAEDQQARYRAVADHLSEAGLPYTVAFDYQPGGIRAGGRAWPLLKMAWAEGTPLNQFAEGHLDDAAALQAAADAWADLLADLEAAGVAHGDLQHGNVLVEAEEDAPRFALVDYDTTFVPALDGRKSAEVGHRNYQHPDRTEDDFGPYLDRFPGLAVYVALRALALRPGLWAQYDTGENLLFRAADFYDPGASPLFEALGGIEEIQPEVNALRAACHQAPEDVPPLRDVLSGHAPTDVAQKATRKSRRSRRAAPREGVARWFAPALAATLVLAAALAVGGLYVNGLYVATLLVLAAGAAAGAMAATRGYRRQPVVRRRRRLRQEVARFAERTENLRREASALRQQREDVQSRREERRAERLAEVREEALRDKLKHHFIGEVRALEGLSHKTVVRLKAAGVRTAYEATPEAVGSIAKLGDRSKARLRMWRASLAERYAGALPEALSPAQERRLRRFTKRRLEQIDREAARTRRKIEAQEAERADAEVRAEALPPLSFGRYLRYLFRLEPALPAPEEAPAPLPAAPPRKEKPRAPEALPRSEGQSNATETSDAAAPSNGAAKEPAPWYER